MWFCVKKKLFKSVFLSFSFALSLTLSPSSHWLCHSLIHVYAHSYQNIRCSSSGLVIWNSSLLSKAVQSIPSLDECEHPVLHAHMSSMCVYFWTDHTVGKACAMNGQTSGIDPCPLTKSWGMSRKNEEWWNERRDTCDRIYAVKWYKWSAQALISFWLFSSIKIG